MAPIGGKRDEGSIGVKRQCANSNSIMEYIQRYMQITASIYPYFS